MAVATTTSAIWACSSDRPDTGPTTAHDSAANSRSATAPLDAELVIAPPSTDTPEGHPRHRGRRHHGQPSGRPRQLPRSDTDNRTLEERERRCQSNDGYLLARGATRSRSLHRRIGRLR